MNELFFTLKDVVYLGVILTSALGGYFTVKMKTSKNQILINNLSEQLTNEVLRTNKIHEDLIEVKSLLSEIKGMLKKEN
jgi:hypothetical protein